MWIVLYARRNDEDSNRATVRVKFSGNIVVFCCYEHD